MGQIAKLHLEEQQRSFPKIEELKRVEVDANELDELVEEDKGSTSPEPEKRKNEFDETIMKMTL